MFVSIWFSLSIIPKYAQVAKDAAATIEMILRSGSATSVFSLVWAFKSARSLTRLPASQSWPQLQPISAKPAELLNPAD